MQVISAPNNRNECLPGCCHLLQPLGKLHQLPNPSADFTHGLSSHQELPAGFNMGNDPAELSSPGGGTAAWAAAEPWRAPAEVGSTPRDQGRAHSQTEPLPGSAQALQQARYPLEVGMEASSALPVCPASPCCPPQHALPQGRAGMSFELPETSWGLQRAQCCCHRSLGAQEAGHLGKR